MGRIGTTMVVKGKWFEPNSFIPFPEDDRHEFKDHRTIAIEEAPRCEVKDYSNKLERSRQPISKTICAFLNSKKGGTIYLGVLDDGQVKGLKLTLFQMDHVALALLDVLSRFSPPVPPKYVSLCFVPVVEDGKFDADYFAIEERDERRHEQKHLMGTAVYCWCDMDAMALCSHGELPMSVVAEIHVKEWDGKLIEDLPISPVYQNEEGLVYQRRTGSNVQLDIQEIIDRKKEELLSNLKKKKCQEDSKLEETSDKLGRIVLANSEEDR